MLSGTTSTLSKSWQKPDLTTGQDFGKRTSLFETI